MENLTRLSKRIAHALRHNPTQYGVTLDSEGWADLCQLAAGVGTTVETVEEIAAQDSKGRYVIRGGRIRAAQGHTIDVNLQFPSPAPPAVLWHGTTENAYPSIMEHGLLPMERQHVHLSPTREQAVMVGSRRKGELVILRINTGELPADVRLMVAENGVWLADRIPAHCLHRD